MYAAEPQVGGIELSSPLSITQVIEAARVGRSEITAARASTRAAQERGAIVSALEDPMLMPSIDHYPSDPMENGDPMDPMANSDASDRRYDWSFMVEQRFPLSGVRGHRLRAAEAEAKRMSANADRVVLDVELQAAEAFLMLNEVRRMQEVVAGQIVLAEQMIDAAAARATMRGGAQADVLRAEVELARLQGRSRALAAEERGMEAMLNASIGRALAEEIPALENPLREYSPSSNEAIITQAMAQRPELQSGAFEVEKANAEIEVMRSMYKPMGMLRIGTASTMAEGSGAMLTLGISVPIWRGKLRAGVSEARAMENMARADLKAMQEMIRAEAVAARESVIAARENYLALHNEVVPRARQAVEPALAAFTSGTDSLAGVIEAVKTQWAVEGELVMAETRLSLAWLQLDRARGKMLEATSAHNQP